MSGDLKRDDGAKPLVVAHRGGSLLAPENTMLAFERACRLGVDAVECDLQITADGEVVVFHDDTLERLTGLEGTVADYSWNELSAQAIVRTATGEAPIPKFQELCRFLSEAKTGLFAEIKEGSALLPCLKILEETSLHGRVLVGCFERDIVGRATGSKICQSLQLVRSQEDFSLGRWEEEKGRGVFAIGLPRKDATCELVRAIRKSGLEVWLWTLNTREFLREAIAMGVDALISDRPDWAMEERLLVMSQDQ